MSINTGKAVSKRMSVCIYTQILYLFITLIFGLIEEVCVLVKATSRTADGVQK